AAHPGCGLRTESARCRRDTGSPRSVAKPGARAGRSDRRPRSRRPRSARWRGLTCGPWCQSRRPVSRAPPNTLDAEMRALIVTNMYPSPEHPALGSFVRDQVEALRRLPDVELELYAFDPGGPGAYLRAAADLRRRYRRASFDVVHSHFGLTAWPG